MAKNLKDYIDRFNMISTGKTNGYDGGDSCAYGCAILYAQSALKQDSTLDPEAYEGALEKGVSGLFRRHPDETKWYSNIETFSRDQMIPLLAMMGQIKSRSAADLALCFRHLLRGFLFAWNTRQNAAVPGTPQYKWKIPDLTGPDIWGMWIRIFRLWPLYPLLLIADIPTLLGSIAYRTKLTITSLQMNQVLIVDFSNRIYPTPVSWFAKKIYGKQTPISALQATFSPEWQPPVDEYLIKLIEKW